jgi:hypothetical protein
MTRRSALRRAVAGGLDRRLHVPCAMRPLVELAHGRTAGAARTPARTRIGLAVAGSLITLVACSGEDGSASPEPPSPESSETRPSPAAPSVVGDLESEAAAEAAMTVYGDLTELVQDARRDPTKNWAPAYTQVTADPYRSAELLEISALRDRGIAHTGSVTNNPEVADVDLAGGTDGTLQTVTIEDCVDTRDFPAEVQATGEVISVERPPHLAVATVVFYPAPTDRWLVTAVEVKDQTC